MCVTIAPKRRREKSARIARCTAANARVKIGRCPVRKSHNFQLKPGYRANYACTYCGVDMIGDSRADNPCKNAELYVINQELNELPWEPPLATSVPRNGGDLCAACGCGPCICNVVKAIQGE